MSFYNLLHRIFGEYVFMTDAKTFSRFATLLAEESLGIWGIENKADKVIFHASTFNAEAISNLASEAGIVLEIADKKGLPFLFSRYRKRYGMLAGLIFGLFLMLFSQLFVWKITVSGNTEITVAEIERALDECGIAVGSFIPYIDVSADANKLLMSCRDLSSAAISIKGTHLHISVLERTQIPDIVDENGFFNVVAEHDGVIIDIDAADGTPEVKEGDVVYKGELLINSFIEGTNGSFRPTHARGRVYAAVEERFVSEVPFTRMSKVYTGKRETKHSYKILGWEVPFFSLECDYECFDAVSTEKDIKLFGFIELPIRVSSVAYTEYVLEERIIGEEQAELYARAELSDYLAELDLELLSCETDVVINKEKGICKLVANAVLKKDIAKEVPFELINYNISERLTMASE
ncbi:MAG: sporulation protein YqfD [Clostridia bacterium]|nr:sporulation protein YqfD [Clostridia bacterium]